MTEQRLGGAEVLGVVAERHGDIRDGPDDAGYDGGDCGGKSVPWGQPAALAGEAEKPDGQEGGAEGGGCACHPAEEVTIGVGLHE